MGFRRSRARGKDLTFDITGNTTSMTDPKDEPSSEASVWTDLVRWVRQDDKGKDDSKNSSDKVGYVHPALALRGSGPSRGVEATNPIAKGELLIRITSDHVLSGATKAANDETGERIATETTPQASLWLKCVGAFLKAKQDQKMRNEGSPYNNYGPYLNSLPKLKEYETLHNWSIQAEEVQSFLKGTTLGNLVAIDRSTKGIQTRYRNSVEPYLRKIGAIADEDSSKNDETLETSASYQSFLEASMCISTRGFHLLPTTPTSTEPKETRGQGTTATTNTKSYDGPFLLPIIDLLNHDPENACTTLRRHQSTEADGGSYFAMVAERDIAKGEEIFHSYGSDMTSAQLLQTFGFVPRKHSTDALEAVASDPLKVSQSSTPVGLSAKDHLVAASRSLKASSFPDAIMDRIRAQNGGSAEGYDGQDDEDEDDSFWEVCDIPDRPKMASGEEFLVSASQASGIDSESLLTEDIVTLVVAQFLPKDAFDEIFPSGDDSSSTVRLDRSILIEDYYLGMLVCKSLLVALFLKARNYCCNNDTDDKDKTAKEEPADFVAKAISVAAPSGVVGRYISSLLETETTRIRELLGRANAESSTANFREIYGRTIRTEEMTNLLAFSKEIEGLMATLSLDGEGDPGGDADPPHKRARVE